MAKFQPASRTNALARRDTGGDPPDLVRVDLDAEDPNDFEVVEVDDTPEGDRGKPTEVFEPVEGPSEDELRSLSSRTQSRIKRMTFERETERRGREQAERERDAAVTAARRAMEENERLKQGESRSAQALGASMLARNESESTAAQGRLEQAIADGDAAAQAKATADISRLASEAMAIKQRTPRAPAPGQQQAQPQQQQVAQPQRQTQPIPPVLTDWIARNNSWFGKSGNTDQARTRTAYGINDALVLEGMNPTTPEFVVELDRRLKAVYPDHRSPSSNDDGGQSNGRERSTSRRPNPVAEGSREGRNTTGAGPRTVELTSSQMALAKRLGVTPQAYARSLVEYEAKQKEGAR